MGDRRWDLVEVVFGIDDEMEIHRTSSMLFYEVGFFGPHPYPIEEKISIVSIVRS